MSVYGNFITESSKNIDSALENFVLKQIKKLVPKFDSLKLKASVSKSSYSIEFFVTVNGKKMQNFEMIENEMFTEKEFNNVSKNIANYIRKMPNFDQSKVNKYTIIL